MQSLCTKQKLQDQNHQISSQGISTKIKHNFLVRPLDEDMLQVVYISIAMLSPFDTGPSA